MAETAVGLPSSPEVVSGSAQLQRKSENLLEVKVQDRSILEYREFQIGQDETLRFVQESKGSSVLNRVKGPHPAEIFGRLESNGRVFLVSPEGIYFGPKSQVHVGSLIASTLDLTNEDFLQENYAFALENKASQIVHQGSMESIEGSIALLAPTIDNAGSIIAEAGSVHLLSAEHVTLDFTGDGLMRFSLEGALKESFLSQSGQVIAGQVEMRIPAARRALADVVNLSGAECGEVFIEENGRIKLVSLSSLKAEEVSLEASQLHIQGTVEAQKASGEGGSIHLLGRDIHLEGALLDVSAPKGAGEVLVGGGYQGGGDLPWSRAVLMDGETKILASALEKGDGGLVVLWSNEYTEFKGQIVSHGGFQSGDGGLVETSGKLGLRVTGSEVDTGALAGTKGQWLLDPNEVIIKLSADDSCDFDDNVVGGCGTSKSSCVIDVDTFDNSNSNVTIQAQSIIKLETEINMEKDGSGLTFKTCAYKEEEGTPPKIELNYNVTTKGAKIVIDMTESGDLAELTIPGDITLDTTRDDKDSGDNIKIYAPIIDVSSNQNASLTLKPGTGGLVEITEDVSIGGTLSVQNSSGISLSGVVSAAKGISFDEDVTVTLLPIDGISTLKAESGTITTGPIVPSQEGTNVSLIADPSKTITLAGSIGTSSDVRFTSISIDAGFLQASSMTASEAITIDASMTLNGSSTISSTNGPILFNASVNGSSDSTQSLTVDAGPGSITVGSVGGTVPLNTLSFSGDSVNLRGLSSDGKLWVADTITLAADLSSQASFTVTNGSDFTLNGNIDLGPGSFRQKGAGNVLLGGDITAGLILFDQEITLTSDASLISNSTLDLLSKVQGQSSGAQSLTLSAVTDASVNKIGDETALKSFSLTAIREAEIKDIITNAGAIDLTAESIVLLENVTIDTTNEGGSGSGPITITGDINALSSAEQSLTLNATVSEDASAITLTGSMGASMPLSTFIVSGDPSNQNSELKLGMQGVSTIEIVASDVMIEPRSILFSDVDFSVDTLIMEGSSVSKNDGDQGMNISATGAVTLAQIGTQDNPMGSMRIEVGNTSYLDTIITGGGTLTLVGPSFILGSSLKNSIVLSTIGDSSFPGAAISVSGLLDAGDAGDVSLTLKATGNGVAGLITLEDSVGSLTSFNSITAEGSRSIYDSRIALGSTGLTEMTIVAKNATDFSGLYGIDVISDLQVSSSLSNVNFGAVEVTGSLEGLPSLSLIGDSAVTLGPAGLVSPLGEVSLSAAAVFFSSIRTRANSINITGEGLLIGDSTLDTTYLGASGEGADISFSSLVDVGVSGSFDLIAYAGSAGAFTVSDSIGAATPLNSLQVLSGRLAEVKDVSVREAITLTPPLTLTKSSTLFSSSQAGDIRLGKVDGSSVGAESLTLSTEGFYRFEDIGSIFPLASFSVTQGTQALIQSIEVTETLTLDPPLLLEASSTISTIANGASGSSITLSGIDGTSTGEQDLTLLAGEAEVTFTGLVGYEVPIGSIDVQASSIAFESALISGAGSHTYRAPVTVSESIVFRAKGDMSFDSTLNVSDSLLRDSDSPPSLFLYPGGGTLTIADTVGQSPFGNMRIYNASSVELSAVNASDLAIAGGLASVNLKGPMSFTGLGGLFIGDGPLQLGSSIDAAHVWFRAQGNITKTSDDQSINVFSSDSPLVFEYFNAVDGNIGSFEDPIVLNTLNRSSLGAEFRADFAGEPFEFSFFEVKSNPPCIITFNSAVVFDCNPRPPSVAVSFNSIPKNLLYITWTYSSWFNLSSPLFFMPPAIYPAQNPADTLLTYYEVKPPYMELDIERTPPKGTFDAVTVISLEYETKLQESVFNVPLAPLDEPQALSTLQPWDQLSVDPELLRIPREELEPFVPLPEPPALEPAPLVIHSPVLQGLSQVGSSALFFEPPLISFSLTEETSATGAKENAEISLKKTRLVQESIDLRVLQPQSEKVETFKEVFDKSSCSPLKQNL